MVTSLPIDYLATKLFNGAFRSDIRKHVQNTFLCTSLSYQNVLSLNFLSDFEATGDLDNRRLHHVFGLCSSLMLYSQISTKQKMSMHSSVPSLEEKSVLLLSGGVESTTMLHMRNSEVRKIFSSIASDKTPSADDILPLFINYGEC